MNFTDVMNELKSYGTAQNRKVYARHGVQEPMFGVSYAHQKTLAKKIKCDHALAAKLWGTGNHDARILATYVADPAALTVSQINAWVRDLDNYVLTDALSKLFARRADAVKLAEKYARSPKEWPGALGWTIIAIVAMGNEELNDAWFSDKIDAIENRIHAAENRVRHAMNMALIGMGMRNAALKKRALEAARRIGKVEVDHGETGCKTPDAAAYIKRAVSRKRAMRKSAKKSTAGAAKTTSRRADTRAPVQKKTKKRIRTV